MKTVKISVFAIGVALSVAPFFNSARAQSTTDSAAILLELQALRSEIADLRDMVERQQFELKRLKQKEAHRPNQQLSRGVDAQGGVGGGAYSQNYQGDRNTQTSANTFGFEGISSDSPLDPNSNVSSPNTQAVPQYTENQTVLDNGVQVLERDIDGSSNAVNPRLNGPEIIERSIDGYQVPANASIPSSDQINVGVNDNNNGDIQPLPQGQRPYIGQNQFPTNSSNPTSVPQQTGRPVIAVPNGLPITDPVINENTAIDARAPLTAPGDQSQARTTQSVAKFTEDQYYDRGFSFLKQSQYDEAVNVFKQQIVDYPQGDLADDAHYWIAEAMFINRKPNEARPHLRAIIDNYPQSARLPDAMLKSAYIEQDLGNLIEARILLQEIVARHPSSNAAIAAKNRLENLQTTN